MNLSRAKSESLFLKKKRCYSTEARLIVEREKPALSRNEVTKILKELPEKVFTDFLDMFSDYKNRKPFSLGHQKIPVFSKSFQIISKEEVDPKLINCKEIMHLWCDVHSEVWDDEKERRNFSNFINSKATEDEIKQNERIKEGLQKLANFIVNNSLEEYTPNLMNYLREQGLYNEFSGLAMKIYTPGETSRHETTTAQNYYAVAALESHVNKLNMLPFNPTDMINGGDYDRIRLQREKEAQSLKHKNGKISEKMSKQVIEGINNTIVNTKKNEGEKGDEGENFDETVNREGLGLTPTTPTSTNVINEKINEKNENMRTAHGCAILQNSHRVNQNSNQFFLKNVTDDANRIINKIRKICFHGAFPFAKQRLIHLGTFCASLKKGAKYHLFEIPMSGFTELIANRDRLEIFSLEDLKRFTVNFNSEKPGSSDCDRWVTNPSLSKKEKVQMFEEMGIPPANKFHPKVVKKVLTGEFSLVFDNHSDAAVAMRILINNPHFNFDYFTVTWDAALLKDPVLKEQVKEKKENRKIFKSSFSREAEEDKKMITRGLEEQEPLNFFQKLSAIYQEVVIGDKRKDKTKDKKNENKEMDKFLEVSSTTPQELKKSITASFQKKKDNNIKPNNLKNPIEEKKDLSQPTGNKMQFWNVQYKLVLEALKTHSYDRYKTAAALGITIRSLSKTILALQSKKYDLYLPDTFKLRVGISDSNLTEYQRVRSNKKSKKDKKTSLFDDREPYLKLRKERGIEKWKIRQEKEKQEMEENKTNTE
jgi:hypothetical protein